MRVLALVFLLAPAVGAANCPAAPIAFSRSIGSCVSTSGCRAPHCDCDSSALAEGDCSAADDCVGQGARNCSADARCRSFSVRSDCSTGGGATTAKRWVTHREGCNGTVANAQWVAYALLAGPPCPPPPPPTPPSAPPLLPKWRPTYDMMRSTMLYTCNHSGFHNASCKSSCMLNRVSRPQRAHRHNPAASEVIAAVACLGAASGKSANPWLSAANHRVFTAPFIN